jgi:type II secretory pathway pseudopilin PulG
MRRRYAVLLFLLCVLASLPAMANNYPEPPVMFGGAVLLIVALVVFRRLGGAREVLKKGKVKNRMQTVLRIITVIIVAAVVFALLASGAPLIGFLLLTCLFLLGSAIEMLIWALRASFVRERSYLLDSVKPRKMAVAGVGLILVTVLIMVLTVWASSKSQQMWRDTSNEAAARGYLRTINSAQAAFRGTHGRYATSFDELTSAKPAYLDGDWNVPKSRYRFTLAGDGQCYEVRANPEDGETGVKNKKFFFTNETGVIRYALGAPANATSKALDE